MTDRNDLPNRRPARVAVACSLALLAAFLGVTLANVFASTPGSLVRQGGKLTGGAGESGEGRFGHSVAASGNGATVMVGAPDDDGALGAVWVFERSGSTWTQPGTMLTGGEEEIGEGHFGACVVLSADGDTALVGAPRDDGGLGAVWVFTRSGSTWTRQAKLTGGAEESASGGWFGDSVALSADGETALVSAPVDHGDTGAVWVFTRSGSTWTRQAKLTGGTEESTDSWFGGSVALSADGDTAMVGDPADQSELGAVWVFTRSGSTWTQQGAKLMGVEESGEGRFGSSVSMSADGDTALVGGRSDGTGSGAAWVFMRSGTAWEQQGAKLTGGEEAGGEGESGEEEGGEESGQGRFGGSVALSAGGDTALVGARNDDAGRGSGAGVYALGFHLDAAGRQADGHRRGRQRTVRLLRGAVGRRPDGRDRWFRRSRQGRSCVGVRAALLGTVRRIGASADRSGGLWTVLGVLHLLHGIVGKTWSQIVQIRWWPRPAGERHDPRASRRTGACRAQVSFHRGLSRDVEADDPRPGREAR